jgi:hypothetical protein
MLEIFRKKRNPEQPLIEVVAPTPEPTTREADVEPLPRNTLTAVPAVVPVPAQSEIEPHAERHLIFELPDIHQRITVTPAGYAQFNMEHGPFQGQIKGCVCISISGLISITGSSDETLRISIDGVCEIKSAKSFSIVEGEPDDAVTGDMQIRPGNIPGVIHIRAGTIRIEITGDGVTVLPKRVVERSAAIPPRTPLAIAG